MFKRSFLLLLLTAMILAAAGCGGNQEGGAVVDTSDQASTDDAGSDRANGTGEVSFSQGEPVGDAPYMRYTVTNGTNDTILCDELVFADGAQGVITPCVLGPSEQGWVLLPSSQANPTEVVYEKFSDSAREDCAITVDETSVLAEGEIIVKYTIRNESDEAVSGMVSFLGLDGSGDVVAREDAFPTSAIEPGGVYSDSVSVYPVTDSTEGVTIRPDLGTLRVR